MDSTDEYLKKELRKILEPTEEEIGLKMGRVATNFSRMNQERKMRIDFTNSKFTKEDIEREIEKVKDEVIELNCLSHLSREKISIAINYKISWNMKGYYTTGDDLMDCIKNSDRFQYSISTK